MAIVKVIKSGESGIHLSIDGVEYGYNHATQNIKKLTSGKWKLDPTVNNYVKTILKNQYSQALRAESIKQAHAKQMAFRDKYPTYLNTKQRQREVIDNQAAHTEYYETL